MGSTNIKIMRLNNSRTGGGSIILNKNELDLGGEQEVTGPQADGKKFDNKHGCK